MMHTQRSTTGFSLIEILVSIALLSLMSGIGISLYAIVNNSYSRANTISNIQSQGSSMMEQMERTVRSATNATVSTPCDGTGCTLTLTVPTQSLDYQTKNCTTIAYAWQQSNGTLTRSWQNCSNGDTSGSIALFDTTSNASITVDKIATADSIFTLNSSVNGAPTSVLVSMNLLQGGGVSNPSQVPFVTTISLRDYDSTQP